MEYENSQSFYEVEFYDFKEIRDRLIPEFCKTYREETEEYLSILTLDKDDFTPYIQLIQEKPKNEEDEGLVKFFLYEIPPEEKMTPPVPKWRITATSPKQVQMILDAIKEAKNEGRI